jgi:hypothetical protein
MFDPSPMLAWHHGTARTADEEEQVDAMTAVTSDMSHGFL